MAIRDVVTEGFGNGTFNGTIPLVVTHGYTIGAAASPWVVIREVESLGDQRSIVDVTDHRQLTALDDLRTITRA